MSADTSQVEPKCTDLSLAKQQHQLASYLVYPFSTLLPRLTQYRPPTGSVHQHEASRCHSVLRQQVTLLIFSSCCEQIHLNPDLISQFTVEKTSVKNRSTCLCESLPGCVDLALLLFVISLRQSRCTFHYTITKGLSWRLELPSA